MAVPKYDIKLNPTKYQEDVYGLLALLKPEWKKEDIQIKVLKDGHVNYIFACYVTKLEESVVVRLFGHLQVFAVHKNSEREIPVVLLMHDMGLGVPILCTFENGYCMEYIKGQNFRETPSLDVEEVTRATIRELARYHSKSQKALKLAHQRGINTKPVWYDNCRFSLDVLPDFSDPNVMGRLKDEIPENLRKGYEEVYAKLSKVIEHDYTSRFRRETFCHNDPNPGNIFYNGENKSVTFLDYESCGFNFPAYDLAYFTTTLLSGIRIDITKHIPNRGQIRNFVEMYLGFRKEFGGTESILVTEDVISHWIDDYDVMTMAALLWMSLAIMQFVLQQEGSFLSNTEKIRAFFKFNDVEFPESSSEEEIVHMARSMLIRMAVNRYEYVKQSLTEH